MRPEAKQLIEDRALVQRLKAGDPMAMEAAECIERLLAVISEYRFRHWQDACDAKDARERADRG